MNTILLCGGSLVDVLNNPAHHQLLADRILGKTVLVYLFARAPEKWPTAMQELGATRASCDMKIQWQLATAEEEKRQDQLSRADAVFILGGDEMLFLNTVGRAELAKILEKRFVAGASAGVNIFSSFFYSNDHDEIRPGSGLLPIKTICHFTEQKRAKLSELEKLGPNDRLLALAEGQTEILEISG